MAEKAHKSITIFKSPNAKSKILLVSVACIYNFIKFKLQVLSANSRIVSASKYHAKTKSTVKDGKEKGKKIFFFFEGFKGK